MNPMPSVKSSAGSKNNFKSSIPARVGGDCFVFRQEERFNSLQSSWIIRLNLRIPPTSAAVFADGSRIHTRLGGRCIDAGVVPINDLTVSTKESRIPSSSLHSSMPFSIVPRSQYFGSSSGKTQFSHGNSRGLVVDGFGPFQVSETRKSTGMSFETGVFSGDGSPGEQQMEQRAVGIVETKMRDEAIGSRLSPAVHQFRPQLGRICNGALEKGVACLDPASSSRLHTSFGPWKVERRLKAPWQVTDCSSCVGYERKSPVFGPVLEISSSRHPARSRDAAYYDLSHDASASRNFQNGQNLNDIIMSPPPPPPPAIEALKKESEEPFSFWSMGRYNRAKFVSSAPSSDLSCSFSRKRKPNADDRIISSRNRRHGCDRCHQ